MKPLVSIIIINYNGKDYILDCIKSVFNTEYCTFEVILIDNASTDGGSKKCKEQFPEIRLFENKKNLAMAARNIGIDNAKGDFLVFLDADTIVTSDWLKILLDSYRIHGEGLYQGKMLQRDNHELIESGANMINIFGLSFARGKGSKDVGQYETFETIGFPVGGFTFSSTETIRKIGYIDEERLFFLMMDDADYAWRAWTMGIPSYYEPKSIIYHLGSPILKWSPKKFYFMERNRWICLLCYYSTKNLIKIFPFLILTEIGVFIFLSLKGAGYAKFKSFFSLIRMLPLIIKRRQRMIKKKTKSDKEIILNFVDDVYIPKMFSNSNSLSIFNKVLVSFSKAARKLINLD